MASKSYNKWQDYSTEIRPEYYTKLEEFIAIDNYTDAKKSRAFRLSKNGQSTGVFNKISNAMMRQDEQNYDLNNNQINVME